MSQRGLTIIELLTSLTIGLILSVLATGIFIHVRTVVRRNQARLELHNSARFIYQALRSDLLAMEQEGAFYLETTADANPELPVGDYRHTGEIRLTFLMSKADNNNYDAHNDLTLLDTDLVWTQWRWRQGICALCRGTNSTYRFWEEWGHWVEGSYDFANSDGWGKYFLNLPQPHRASGTSAQVMLDSNAFNSGDAQDIGDYTDMTNNVVPVTRGVTNLALEVVLADGTLIDPSVAATTVNAYDGVYVDGHIPSNAPPPSIRRPRLFRMRFDLTDPQTQVTQSFSFSFQASGPLPPL